MRNWLLGCFLILVGGLTLAACGDTPLPTPTPVPPTATPTATATPIPTATPVPPLSITCGTDPVTAALVASDPGTEGGHAVDMVRQNLNPSFGTPSGPWQVASLTAPGVNWTSTYLVTAGGQFIWFVAGTQVSAVTDEAGQISAQEMTKSFPSCAPPLNTVADHMFNAAPLP